MFELFIDQGNASSGEDKSNVATLCWAWVMLGVGYVILYSVASVCDIDHLDHCLGKAAGCSQINLIMSIATTTKCAHKCRYLCYQRGLYLLF